VGLEVAEADSVRFGDGVGSMVGSSRGAAVPVAASAWGLSVSLGDGVGAGEAIGWQAASTTTQMISDPRP
jgi:hypothetical protein